MQTNPAVEENKTLNGPWVRGISPIGSVIFVMFFLNYSLIEVILFTPRRVQRILARGSRHNPVCLTVRHTRALWQKKRQNCRNFDTIWKGNQSSILASTAVGGRLFVPSKICAHSEEPHSKSANFDSYHLYLWAYELVKKPQLWRTGSWPRTYQRAMNEVRTLLISLPKGGSKSLYVFC